MPTDIQKATSHPALQAPALPLDALAVKCFESAVDPALEKPLQAMSWRLWVLIGHLRLTIGRQAWLAATVRESQGKQVEAPAELSTKLTEIEAQLGGFFKLFEPEIAERLSAASVPLATMQGSHGAAERNAAAELPAHAQRGTAQVIEASEARTSSTAPVALLVPAATAGPASERVSITPLRSGAGSHRRASNLPAGGAKSPSATLLSLARAVDCIDPSRVEAKMRASLDLCDALGEHFPEFDARYAKLYSESPSRPSAAETVLTQMGLAKEYSGAS